MKSVLNIKDVTIWVGAGISHDLPTSLPLGESLTEFVWNKVLVYPENIKEYWMKVNSFMNKEKLIISAYPRLELVLASASYTDRYYLHCGFMEGFKSFNDVDFNHNHMKLASLLHSGIDIITPNFDLCIEHAYEKMYRETLVSHAKKQKEVVRYQTKYGSQIIHYHGTSYSGKSLGATLQNITGIKEYSLFKRIQNCFSNPKKINYFIGYSFSDTYDISIMIKRIYESNSINNTNNNIICNHEGKDLNIERKVRELFKNNFRIITMNSGEFIDNILQTYSLIIPPKKTDNNIIDWKKSFMRYVCKDITYEYKVITTIHLITQMNIAAEKICSSLLNEYTKVIDDCYNCILDKPKIMILEYGLHRDSLLYVKSYGENRLSQEYKKITKCHETYDISELESILKNQTLDLNQYKKKFLDLKYYNYDMSMILSWYRRLMMLYVINGEKAKYMDDIMLFSDHLLSFDYGKMISPILFASALRYKMFIDTYNGINTNILKESINLYYDFGFLSGLVSSCFDYGIAECANKGYEIKLSSNSYLKKGWDMANVLGMRTYMEFGEKYLK